MSVLSFAVLALAPVSGPAAPPPDPRAEVDGAAGVAPAAVARSIPVAERAPVGGVDAAAASDEKDTANAAPEVPNPETGPSVAAKIARHQPLPEPPSRVPAADLDDRAWRGRGFFQIHLAAMIPVGGARPGRGTISSAGGGLQLGWRARPYLAAGVGLTTFLHDTGESVATDSAGENVEVRDFGRLSLFDPFVRFFVPTRSRVEPRFDIGALLGTYRAPFSESPQFAAGARVGAGLDVWIGPAFSLDFGVDPRLIVIDGVAGVTLQAGMGATVHW